MPDNIDATIDADTDDDAMLPLADEPEPPTPGKELATIPPADEDRQEFAEDMTLAHITRNRVFRRAIQTAADADVMNLDTFDALMAPLARAYGTALTDFKAAVNDDPAGRQLAAWRLELDNHRATFELGHCL